MSTTAKPGGGGGTVSSSGGGGGTTDVNLIELAGNALADAGVVGMLGVGGDVADGDAVTASHPVKIGAVVDNVLSYVDDASIVNLITDTYRRLRILEASYDSLTGADKVSNLNLSPDDRDGAPISLGSYSNVAVASYLPDATGYELGNRNTWGIAVAMRDGAFDVEVMTDGTNWTLATKSALDLAEGTSGFDNTHFAEPDVATVYWNLDLHAVPSYKIRIKFTPNNATCSISAYALRRANS